MVLTTLLPILAWVLFLVLFLQRESRLRSAFLAASVAWGTCVVLFTEGLSLCLQLNLGAVALCWVGAAAGAAVIAWRQRKNRLVPDLEPFSSTEKVVAGLVGCILALTLATALAAPPNTWDSMTYHMTRVVFWIQNGSVAHFPTNNLRQIELTPFAEFAIAHLQLLSAGDHLANLVQWFSFAGCIAGVSLIAEFLGAARLGQLVAALATATIPVVYEDSAHFRLLTRQSPL